ncbi:MAG: BMP family ABC transporter substrate-binding protein [Parvibaculaceae bacterium]
MSLVTVFVVLLTGVGATDVNAAGTVAVSGSFRLSAPPKVGMVLFNQRSDGGWTNSFDIARRQLEKDLGQSIDYYNNVDADRAHIIAATERLISKGNNIIIGTGFDYSDPFEYLAERHPNVAFLNGGGVTNGRNLQSFYGRTFDSQYLCGMIAGAMSKTGKLGFVAAFDLPTVVQSFNGFTLGARAMNPKASVDVRFVGSWADPNAEREATVRVIDAGADVVGQHVDTPMPAAIAQERGVLATGNHLDQIPVAPKTVICSSVWQWGRYLLPTIRSIAAGTWKPDPDGVIPDFKDGPVDVVINRALVPDALYDLVMKERQALIDGKNIFTGPMKNNAGVEVLAAGKTLSMADVSKTIWHVEGVVTPENPSEKSVVN